MDAFLLQIDTYLQSSIIASLAAAFAGGLLASLTPCIYPMIPITAGVIGHANVGGSRLRGFLLSLVYVTGMALAYAALGVFGHDVDLPGQFALAPFQISHLPIMLGGIKAPLTRARSGGGYIRLLFAHLTQILLALLDPGRLLLCFCPSSRF